jgi:polysaccharide pyruvyl transferase WcaK-like protein
MLISLSRGRIYNRSGDLVDRTDVMPDARIAALHDKADVSLVRDRATLEHVRSLGCLGARLGGCPTITLGEVAGRLPAAPAPDAGGVLLSVRNPQLMNIPLSVQSRVHEQVRDLIRLLSAHGRVRLLCHDHRDLPFAASFRGTEYLYTDDVAQYLSLVRAADLVVTYRLHSLIPAAAFGTPAVSISYDERAMSCIETIGLGDWDIELMQGDVVAQVQDRLARLDEFDRLCAEAEPVWAALRSEMAAGLSLFKDAVNAYAGEEHEGATPWAPNGTISISSLKPGRITAAS